jgi:hypothetical protein
MVKNLEVGILCEANSQCASLCCVEDIQTCGPGEGETCMPLYNNLLMWTLIFAIAIFILGLTWVSLEHLCESKPKKKTYAELKQNADKFAKRLNPNILYGKFADVHNR